jgi:hypothetical protein
MAGTAADHSTTPHPTSPISPTEALKLALSRDPHRSIHDVVQDLTEWIRRNRCRLWCNGNLLSPDYIATSLVVVARTEADSRPRADVVSSVRELWVQQVYKFEFDADEVRALLPSNSDDLTCPPQTTPEPTAQPEAIEKETSQPTTPETKPKDETKISTKTWITAEARGMKADGLIPAGILITDFAKMLAGRMEKAARSNPRIHPVRWSHIKNELPQWDLWPINKIKN